MRFKPLFCTVEIGQNQKIVNGGQMNRSLARIHLGLVIFYGLIATFICTVYLAGDQSDTTGILILLAMFAALPTLHLVALRGVSTGQAWGRSLSRTLGFLLLFAV
ncbi:MAG: hypothetical protein RR928_17905, partial [Comamonas sp.]|uniref:hypothetical protein n=1 Tax=Comamonas sp. TaxID=34028 RepID=UPI002FC8877C